MRVTLIHNPGAGDDRQPDRDQLKALIQVAGHKVRYQSTREKGWSKVLEKSADMVAVAGGDGTVGKVARRLVGSRVPIAVLPMGTANNVSKTLGISDIPTFQLIREWKSAHRLTFDACVATGPWGERYFIEGLGTGLLTCSIPELKDNETIEQLEHAGVKVTYAQQIFREQLADCPVTRVEATLDGEDISGRYLMFEALNMQYIGPNLFLAPGLVRNDGELDVVLLAEKDRRSLHKYIRNWQEGKPSPSKFRTLRGKRLKIEWTGFPIHIDDRLWPGKNKKAKPPATIDIKVEPKALEFLVPKEAKKNVAKKGDLEKGRKK
ncbi:MAG TPA: diacylglycerol kinase family protein [Burkholderiales bacterium]|nr:diacylglycerol kinase family protein [Burkholderiales bacterium]